MSDKKKDDFEIELLDESDGEKQPGPASGAWLCGLFISGILVGAALSIVGVVFLLPQGCAPGTGEVVIPLELQRVQQQQEAQFFNLDDNNDDDGNMGTATFVDEWTRRTGGAADAEAALISSTLPPLRGETLINGVDDEYAKREKNTDPTSQVDSASSYNAAGSSSSIGKDDGIASDAMSKTEFFSVGGEQQQQQQQQQCAGQFPLVLGSNPNGALRTIVETRATSQLIFESGMPIIQSPEVQEQLPELDPFAGRRYDSCAVVGNSGIMRNSSHGSMIDDHDFVIRFNWPARHGYTQQVGEQTDLMIVGASASLHSSVPPFASFEDYATASASGGPPIVISEVKGYDQWLHFISNRRQHGTPPSQYAFSQFFLHLSSLAACNVFEGHKPRCEASAGLRGVILAAALCKRVDVYGMGISRYSGNGKYYGFGDDPAPPSSSSASPPTAPPSSHSFIRERRRSEHIFRESALHDYDVEHRVIASMTRHATALAQGQTLIPSSIRMFLPSLVAEMLRPGLELNMHLHSTVGQDTFRRRWSSYPRLAIYNEDRTTSTSGDSEHREPPLSLSLTSDGKHQQPSLQLSGRQQIYTDVNVGQPPSYWDYRHTRLEKLIEMNAAEKAKSKSELPASYRRGSKVGHGTYGDVYLARDPLPSGQQVVLKYLRPHDKKWYILSREIMVMRALGGKHHTMPLLDVVSALDPSDKKNKTVLVLPFIRIQSYRSLYAQFEDIHIRYYTYRLFQALDYAHSRGVLHNDIKPLNMLIDGDSHELVVSDWGLSEFFFPENQTLSIHVGTRLWKAPELLMGDRHYGYAVDIWAAGVTVAAMLFRQSHFFNGADNHAVILEQISVLGTEAFRAYVSKYEVPLSRAWSDKHIREFNRKSWASFYTDSSRHLHSPEADQFLDAVLVFDPEERATAKQALALPFFDPVRSLTKAPEWTWEGSHFE